METVKAWQNSSNAEWVFLKTELLEHNGSSVDNKVYYMGEYFSQLAILIMIIM